MRKRSLRSRLTLLVAAAVAIAVAISAVGCWYFVRRELSWQLNKSLREIAVPVKAMQGAVRDCSPEPKAALDGHPAFTEAMQIVFPGGERCVMGNTAIKVTPHEKRVAGGSYGQWEFYDGHADDG